MNLIRVRLVAYVVAVLVCQAAALSAAPLALCRGAMSAASDVDECCKNLGPGQTCPMHHQSHGSPATRGAAWTCSCSASDAVLASIIGLAGALPEPVRVPRVSVCVTVIASMAPSILDRHHPPQYPPPRVSVGLRRV